jgi:hypothetical protein
MALIPLLLIFDSIYEKTTGKSYTADILNKDYIEDYLTSEDEKYGDIPRFQKIAIFMTEFSPGDKLYGKGLGQFKGGTTLALTPFASSYQWLLSGSRAMLFFLIIQTGIIGAVVFLLYWIFLISYKQNGMKVRNGRNIIIFVTICFVLILGYNDSLRSLFFCAIIMYVVTYATTNRFIPKKCKARMRE